MTNRLLRTAQTAARKGGNVLLDWRGRFQAREKGKRDLVTEADLASQEEIRAVLLGEFPEHAFQGEEDDGAPLDTEASHRWIVDPLDGTANYVHGLHSYSVSIALLVDQQIQVGVVYDPNSGEMFSALRGGAVFWAISH